MREVFQETNHFIHTNGVIRIDVDHFENLVEGLIAHFEFLVHFLAQLNKVSLGVSFIKVRVMILLVLVPNFLSESLKAVGFLVRVSSHLFFEELLDLVEGALDITIVFIGANKVALWVFMKHIVEVVIVSEQSVSWAENLSGSNEAREGTCTKRYNKSAEKGHQLHSGLISESASL